MTSSFTAYDSTGQYPLFAIVADDGKVQVVTPNAAPDAIFDPDLEAERIGSDGSADEILAKARKMYTGAFYLDPTVEDDEASTFAQAVKNTRDELNATFTVPPEAADVQSLVAARTMDDVSQDYPGEFDVDYEPSSDDQDEDNDDANDRDGGTISAEAMNQYVLSLISPIDPEGPNGWILRAMDGNPRPGDENAQVVLPGRIPVRSSNEGESE